MASNPPGISYAMALFIRRVGQRLELPVTAIGTATVFYHRSMQSSCSNSSSSSSSSSTDAAGAHTVLGSVGAAASATPASHSQRLVAACLFLASKSEECPRALRDVLNMVHAERHSLGAAPSPAAAAPCAAPAATPASAAATAAAAASAGGYEPMALDESYWAAKEQLVGDEQRLLRALGFEVEVTHPHRYVPEYAAALGLSARAVQVAWCLATDSYLAVGRTLQHPPHAVAAAAVLLGSALCGERAAVPPRRTTPPPPPGYAGEGRQGSGSHAAAVPAAAAAAAAAETATAEWWVALGSTTAQITELSAVLIELIEEGGTGRGHS